MGLWLETQAIVSGCWEFQSRLYILLAVWTLGKLLTLSEPDYSFVKWRE